MWLLICCLNFRFILFAVCVAYGCDFVDSTSGGGAVNAPRTEPELDPEPTPPAAPLRRPRSPEPARERRDDEFGCDRAPPRKFGPPGSHMTANAQPTRGGYRNARGMSRPNPSSDRSDDRRSDGDRQRPSDNRASDRSDDRSGYGGRSDNRERKPRDDAVKSNILRDAQKEEDEWNAPAKPEPQPASKPHNALPTPPALRSKTTAPQESKPPQKAPEMVREAPKALPAKTLAPKAEPPKAEAPKVEAPKVEALKDAPAAAVSENLVPKDSLVDLLEPKAVFTLSVDAPSEECRDEAGFVCLALHENYTEQYMSLLDDAFTMRQETSEVFKPAPGDTFSFLNPEDGGWYRARCLAPNLAALLDGSKLVELTPSSACRRTPAQDCLLPEFCCVLQDAEVQVGAKLNATVVSKSSGALTVALADLATGAAVGVARVRRWAPRADRPRPVAAPSSIPTVPRPPLSNNSQVLIVDATRPDRVVVRPAAAAPQRRFDDVVAQAALGGASAAPLKEPPTRGQTVLAKFEDGNHYRALCRRVNSKLNKYLLEYIDYGNESVAFLEDIYPCPPSLALERCPALASVAALPTARAQLAGPAADYIDRLKDEAVPLTLTLPSGEQSAPSGAVVRLAGPRGEDVARELDRLCTPEWQRLLDRGGDVLEMESVFLTDVEHVELAPGELEITDCGALRCGMLSGHARAAPHAARARALAPLLEEYGNSALCKDPYLPRVEELCTLKCPTTGEWVRAVMLEQNGSGGSEATLFALDRGSLLNAPVAALRRLPPELLRAAPAAACSLELRDFPKDPTEEQMSRALKHLQMDAAGRGVLRVARVQRQLDGDYLVDAPELLRAVRG